MTTYSSLPIWMDAAIALLNAHPKGVVPDINLEDDSSGEGLPGRVNVEVIADAWRQAAEVTGDPAIGIHAVQDYFQPASWRSIGLAMLCSSSLREAFDRLVRYSVFLTDAGRFLISEGDGYTEVYIEMDPDPAVVGYEVLDFGGAAILTMLRMIYPGALNPQVAYLFRPQPQDVAPYQKCFGEGVIFGQNKMGFRFSQEQMNVPSLAPNNELALIQDRLTEDYIARLNNDSVSLKAKHAIIAMLPSGEVTAVEVAEKLNMSVRNLQRKLNAENSSFKDLLEEVRRAMVLEYLMDSRHSMNEIAYLLGFSDHSNFARAFRRWFNMSPSEKRRELLSE
ncbi:MAG: AraC family transcriptional regulator [Candidatus Pelagadaptatus aseana]|uniref:helix-turn-helix transcriptional regulator n=1 Tax=Candidatus Pelagadaptatus aseana TaxID=3120508 RepID=UPI0039B2E1BA